MISLEGLAASVGVDLSRISPEMSLFDTQMEMANQAVRNWMKNKENRDYLNDKKADYIHDKGWTVGKGFKHECDIPQEAFLLLPRQVRNDRKRLMRWVNEKHPYLMHRRIV